MRGKGLFIVFLLAAAVVFFLLFARVGKKSSLERLVDVREKAVLDTTRANMETLARAVEFFVGVEGRLPEDLAELARARITGVTSVDGWGRSLRYEKLSTSSFRLTSAGQDGRFGSQDDLVITR